MDEHGARTRTPIGRRAFLKGAGATSLVAASPLPDKLLRWDVLVALVEQDGVLTTTLYRPDDQLRLRFEFPGLAYDASTNALVASGVGTPLVRIIYPAQHLSERPVTGGGSPSADPIEHRIGGTSRLVYQVDPPIPFTVPALLALGIATTADGSPQVLTDSVSMIEIPADLRLSPEAVSPVSDLSPVTFADVTQLHRTILTSNGSIDVTPADNARITDGFAGRVPSASQRTSIVNAGQASGPATADRLWLTPHGAWADLRGNWPTLKWVQHVVGGRDQFVEIVETGALMPFGIPMTWITTTTRQWQVDAGGGVVAALVGTTQVVLLDDTVTYDPATLPYEGRAWPFREVSIVLEGPLDALKEQIVLGDGTNVATELAWKVVQDTAWGAYRRTFAYRAVDMVGNEIEFNLPGVFVTADGMGSDTIRSQVEDFYRTGSQTASDLDTYTRIRPGNAPVAFAPEEESGSGRTTLTTSDIWMRVDLPAPVPDGPPSGTAPSLDRAEVFLPAEIQQGLEGGPIPTVDVSFPERWLEHGADPGTPEAPKNPDLGFLDVDDPPDVGLGGQARAVMTPNVLAESFNQTFGFGPLPDLTLGGPPRWSPADAFGDVARILKGVKLGDLVDSIDLFDAIPGIDIPTLRIDFLPITLPDKIEYTYEWCPDGIKSVETAGFITTPDTRLCVRMTTVVGLNPSVSSGGGVEFEVTNFTLQIPPILALVELDVAALRAVQPIGGSFDLTFDVTGWRLGGDLEWLEPLVRLLSPRGDAFDIEIGSQSIELDLTLPLPNINLGLLSIRNVAIGLGGDFPFTGDGDPLVRFTAGTRSSPITVSLLQFTGTFTCQLDFTAQGLETVRIKVGVSACLFNINVVIAKADFTISVDLDFRLTNGEVKFVGSIAVSASLSVLGITANVTIEATVKYDSHTQMATASGEIRWSVSSFLGSANGAVPLGQVEFELGSGGNTVQGLRRSATSALRPANADLAAASAGFGDQYDFESWTSYRSAFAAA